LKKVSVCIFGSGSWATAIAKILCESEHVSHIKWWLRKPEYVEAFRRFSHNPNYLSSVHFDQNKVWVFDQPERALEKADMLVLAQPSAFVGDTLSTLPNGLPKDIQVISAVKGMVPSTKEILTDYLTHSMGVSDRNLVCVSGPCHAEEVARERLSYLTVASPNRALSLDVAALFSCRYIQTIISGDMKGVEYAAVLKNIYAIAAGIANGLGYGDNFIAVLISYALREMQAFMSKMGLKPDLATHSAYLGDLLVTAYSQFSRNRTFGNMLGRGYTVSSAQMEMKMIAEGYYSTKQVFLLNGETAEAYMPIMDAVYRIIYESQPPALAFDKLSRKIS
jgi:glycerol-3-phosphate dehydrogenase (NAD(P)+)